MKIVLIIISLLALSCSHPDDTRCYAVDYIEVEGEKIKVGEFKCGCFPTSKPQSEDTYTYEGETYVITKTFECY